MYEISYLSKKMQLKGESEHAMCINKKKIGLSYDNGKVELKCIDPIEEVMKYTKDILTEYDLIDLLDPISNSKDREIMNYLYYECEKLHNLYAKNDTTHAEKQAMVEEAKASK